jgi:hypothetical protein
MVLSRRIFHTPMETGISHLSVNCRTITFAGENPWSAKGKHPMDVSHSVLNQDVIQDLVVHAVGTWLVERRIYS